MTQRNEGAITVLERHDRGAALRARDRLTHRRRSEPLFQPRLELFHFFIPSQILTPIDHHAPPFSIAFA
jgi:hypothetical protein